MGLTLREQPAQQPIERKLVNDASITIGKSGALPVDKTFLERYTMVDGKPVRRGNTDKEHQRQAQTEGEKALYYGASEGFNKGITGLLEATKTFSYHLTSRDNHGNPITIITTLQHAEKNSAVTDYYGGHVQGQIASQVAYELQQRYGKQMTLADFQKIDGKTSREDQIKIQYLDTFLKSNKMKTIYADPKFLKAYPDGASTYLQLMNNPKYIGAIQNLINNRNRGLTLVRERAELDALEGGGAEAKVSHYAGGNETVTQYESKSDKSFATEMKSSIHTLTTSDPTKMTLDELHVALAKIDQLNATYARLGKISPSDRLINERIIYDNLDLNLKQLQDKFVDLTEFKIIAERKVEERVVEQYRTDNNAELDKFIIALRNIKNLKNPQLKAEIDRLNRITQDTKQKVLKEQSHYPHIMKETKPPSVDHLILANAYGNWSTLYRWLNTGNTYKNLTSGNFSPLSTIPTLKDYTPPKHKPKPPVVNVVKKAKPILPKITFDSVVEKADAELLKSQGSYWSATPNPTLQAGTDMYSLTTANDATDAVEGEDPTKMTLNELKAYIKRVRLAQGRQNLIDYHMTDYRHHYYVDQTAKTRLEKRLVVAEGLYNILELKAEKQGTMVGMKAKRPTTTTPPQGAGLGASVNKVYTAIANNPLFVKDLQNMVNHEKDMVGFWEKMTPEQKKSAMDAWVAQKENNPQAVTETSEFQDWVEKNYNNKNYAKTLSNKEILTLVDDFLKNKKPPPYAYKPYDPQAPQAPTETASVEGMADAIGKPTATVGNNPRPTPGKTDDATAPAMTPTDKTTTVETLSQQYINIKFSKRFSEYLEMDGTGFKSFKEYATAEQRRMIKEFLGSSGADPTSFKKYTPPTPPPTQKPTQEPTQGGTKKIPTKKDLDAVLGKELPSGEGLTGKKVKDVKFTFDDEEDGEELIDRRYIYPYYYDKFNVKTYFKPYRMSLGYKQPLTAKELRSYHLQFNFIGVANVEKKRNPYEGGAIADSEYLKYVGAGVGALLGSRGGRFSALGHIMGFISGRVNTLVEAQAQEDLRRTMMTIDISHKQRLLREKQVTKIAINEMIEEQSGLLKAEQDKLQPLMEGAYDVLTRQKSGDTPSYESVGLRRRRTKEYYDDLLKTSPSPNIGKFADTKEGSVIYRPTSGLSPIELPPEQLPKKRLTAREFLERKRVAKNIADDLEGAIPSRTPTNVPSRAPTNVPSVAPTRAPVADELPKGGKGKISNLLLEQEMRRRNLPLPPFRSGMGAMARRATMITALDNQELAQQQPNYQGRRYTTTPPELHQFQTGTISDLNRELLDRGIQLPADGGKQSRLALLEAHMTNDADRASTSRANLDRTDVLVGQAREAPPEQAMPTLLEELTTATKVANAEGETFARETVRPRPRIQPRRTEQLIPDGDPEKTPSKTQTATATAEERQQLIAEGEIEIAKRKQQIKVYRRELETSIMAEEQNDEAMDVINRELIEQDLSADAFDRARASGITNRAIQFYRNRAPTIDQALRFTQRGVETFEGAEIGYYATRYAQPYLQMASNYIFPTRVGADGEPPDGEPPDGEPDGDPDPDLGKPRTSRKNKRNIDINALRGQISGLKNEAEVSQFIYDTLRKEIAVNFAPDLYDRYKNIPVPLQTRILATLRYLSDPRTRRDASEIIYIFNDLTGMNLPDVMFQETQGVDAATGGVGPEAMWSRIIKQLLLAESRDRYKPPPYSTDGPTNEPTGGPTDEPTGGPTDAPRTRIGGGLGGRLAGTFGALKYQPVIRGGMGGLPQPPAIPPLPQGVRIPGVGGQPATALPPEPQRPPPLPPLPPDVRIPGVGGEPRVSGRGIGGIPRQPQIPPQRRQIPRQRPTGINFHDLPQDLRNYIQDLAIKAEQNDNYKRLYDRVIKNVRIRYNMKTLGDADYDKEINIARGYLDQIEEEEKKRKKKLNPDKPILVNTRDIHAQYPTAPPTGFLTHKKYKKKVLDNFKNDSGVNSRGYRTIMKDIGTSKERINSQRKFHILSKDTLFDLPEKKQQYNYKRIS